MTVLVAGQPVDDQAFRTMFEQSPVSTQVFAPDGSTLAVNAAWERLWGVTLEQLGGYNVLEDPQLVAKGIMPDIRRGFAGETVEIQPIKYEPDQTAVIPGSVDFRWVRARLYPVIDAGMLRAVVLMHEDITEQRLAEDALQQSEARFRAMFNSAPVGISLIDDDGRYLAVNPARQAMLGYSEAELLGRSYLEFTYPDDVEYDLEVNRRADKNQQAHLQLEKRFIARDGSVGWARVTAARVADASGKTLYSISIAEDITGQKKSEEERSHLLALERGARIRMAQLAAERAAILGQIADGLVLADPSGRITFANAAALRLLGRDPTGVEPSGYTECLGLLTADRSPLPPQDFPLIRALAGGDSVVAATWRIRRPDGTEVVAHGSATAVRGEDGNILGAVLTMRDVTDEFDLERQKDEFLSALAHDLRTPLTTIKGRIQILQRRARTASIDSAELVANLERIDAGTARMIALISELLDVANIQLGRPVTLARRPTDLVEVVRAAVADVQQSTDRHSIVLDVWDEPLIGQWDPMRLDRVLGNLLSNAIKYSPDGGQVRLTIEAGGTETRPVARVQVIDSGVGIPVDELPHVFERFHRGHNVRSQIPGTGIGLAAVRSIVEQYGGTVEVESIEGQGSTFTVTLPLDGQMP